MTKTFQDEILFGFLKFCNWKLFDICNLIFGISIIINELPTKQIPSGDNQSLVLWTWILLLGLKNHVA